MMLWHRGADVNVMDVEERSPLILAAMHSAATGIIRLLSGVCADNETIEVGVGLPRLDSARRRLRGEHNDWRIQSS